MTKSEAMRITRQQSVLMQFGFTMDEADKLRRISMTLRRWHELECGIEGGAIERDEKTNKPHWVYSGGGFGTRRSVNPIADREAGALRRLKAIITARNGRNDLQCEDRNYKCDNGTFDIVTADGEIRLQNVPAEKAVMSAYVQGDPRGAALYIIRPGDITQGQTVDSCYSRGICVY